MSDGAMAFFGELRVLRERPIPDQATARQARIGYRSHPIDPASPEHAEPLVDAVAAGLAGENAYFRHDAPPYYHRAPGAISGLFLRRSVVERLLAVDARLRPRGLRLHLYDAWRPVAVQRYFHDEWMPRHLRAERPELAGAALTAEVERYWAAPTRSPESPAPHETGAAVDLTIALARTGEPLEMGSVFDDMHPVAAADFFESAANVRGTGDREARGNRRLLRWAMAAAGFAGHPDEWWHFSWGDQMWARLTGASAARFGLAQPDAG